MRNILLAGATGHVGQHLLRELKRQGYPVSVLARTAAKANQLLPPPDNILVADATKPETLRGCCQGMDVVVSTLGKSISLTDNSKGSFQEVDYRANYNLLQEAKAAGVQQFVYVSAFSAEAHPQLAYFKAHADFARELKHSDILYTILEPTALFSAFDEVVAMARKGRIGLLGTGDKLTNPIYEGDLAKIAVGEIGCPSRTIALGGKTIYSRAELIRLACKAANYKGFLPSVPFPVVASVLPLVKLLNRNLYDKVSFMIAVSKVDCVAPQVGAHTLEEYFHITPKEPA
ncbi:uncharacterized protein YbjT (DUF2867 family) [Pontibacter ummariensis]|uniref:Uncharacterized conserved protein YbjT, contains NAD(P)-binding and DUF2867 domains n=1 Tax=Pontibacter ummariensis TaxID=1610492 RepID=A0A239C7K7_9BACT|nr:SDR family oxidoreductase [Pontibacter ummariensis]PRY15425.1 uncharacterized protein YbjT (DUF2867 family) [Pontibacter ummariensis]SNS15648.1 Uncharacterized conserved protein YbjT, contains NAD(P)-binding and DUF2867 domains [Pontibacter ummariensis]